MKNKSTLKFCVFLLSCCFSLLVNAQQNNDNIFQLEVIEYSPELDSNKVHNHIVSLKNNSNKELTFNLSTIVDDTNGGDKKNNKNIIVELLSEGLNKRLNSITLSSKQSIKFIVKITNHPNARLGSMNVCKVIAQLSNSDDNKIIKINAYISHPNSLGH